MYDSSTVLGYVLEFRSKFEEFSMRPTYYQTGKVRYYFDDKSYYGKVVGINVFFPNHTIGSKTDKWFKSYGKIKN